MKTILLICLTLTSFKLHAQVKFITSGKIEFEKRVNVHNNMGDDSWAEQMKKMVPKIKFNYYDMVFNETEILYKPGKEAAETATPMPDWFLGPATDNIVYTNLTTSTQISKKTVFENSYLIQDSIRTLNWKITEEIRTIAGFECRKAVGKIMDSVYVIAFYTDQIITSGGPESFNGLPGMILGIAIPRLYTTWYATKVVLTEIKQTDLVPPTKGKKINSKELQALLKKTMKDWGKDADRNVWQVML
jgi:GLPGLI family protein